MTHGKTGDAVRSPAALLTVAIGAGDEMVSERGCHLVFREPPMRDAPRRADAAARRHASDMPPAMDDRFLPRQGSVDANDVGRAQPVRRLGRIELPSEDA